MGCKVKELRFGLHKCRTPVLAVVVGGKVSGVFGIILFIPLFSVIYALVRRSVYSRLRRKGITISE